MRDDPPRLPHTFTYRRNRGFDSQETLKLTVQAEDREAAKRRADWMAADMGFLPRPPETTWQRLARNFTGNW